MDNLVMGLATIVGLFLTVGAPIIKLNSTITKVISRIDNIEERQRDNKETMHEMKEKSRESHQRIHSRIDKVEENVSYLDHRVSKLEER